MSKNRIFKSKRIIFFLFFFMIIFLILKISVEKFLLNFPYFKIEEIDFKDKKLSLDYLRGNSIFNIDLKKTSDELTSRYPEFKEIILNFRFPSKLNIEVKEHIPVAKLILNKEFFVDEEARIFFNENYLDFDIPKITGLQSRILLPQVYRKYPIPELLLSLDLIRISPLKIKRIEASRKEELTFFLDKGLKIKIGYGDYPERLERLSLLMKEFEEKVEDIDYIDLRFSDPVIKFKDER